MDLHETDEAGSADARPSIQDAERAVRTLISWAGDNPAREGLRDTPSRVIKAYRELFGGYGQDVEKILSRTFEEVGGYDDVVMVKGIHFFSHCEHHLVPFFGKVHVAYRPSGRVLGLSKIARVVELYARRLQTQEALTAEICRAIDQSLQPRGVGVMIEAEHLCMAMRGVRKPGSLTATARFSGVFETDAAQQARFMMLARA
jgi:GTP cyclohydrolase I